MAKDLEAFVAAVARAPQMTRSPASANGGVGYRHSSGTSIIDEVGNRSDTSTRRRGERLTDATPVILTTSMPVASPSYFASDNRGFLVDALRQQSRNDGKAHLDSDEWMQWAREFYDGVTDADIRDLKRDVELQDQQAWDVCSWGARRAATVATSITGGNEKRRFRRMTQSR